MSRSEMDFLQLVQLLKRPVLIAVDEFHFPNHFFFSFNFVFNSSSAVERCHFGDCIDNRQPYNCRDPFPSSDSCFYRHRQRVTQTAGAAKMILTCAGKPINNQIKFKFNLKCACNGCEIVR